MTALVRHEERRYVVPIAVVSLLSTVATLAAPRLAGSPLLLMALAPRLPFLLLTGDRVPLLLFFLVGVVRPLPAARARQEARTEARSSPMAGTNRL